ncbi:hypothetical protein BGZ76_003827 [Entomortierella beljakovae]|nr:hypothetical protein BGZ76_003827 [Entomortierella beljakovae]
MVIMQPYRASPYQRPPPRHQATTTALSPMVIDQKAIAQTNRVRPQMSYNPIGSGASQVPVLSSQKPPMATFSAQARKTLTPQQLSNTPNAAMVPIYCLQPQKAFVRVSGRTVRAPDVKEFKDKRENKQKWIQSFTIKDDRDTIEVKIWHKTQEHMNSFSHLTLDQVVHIWTDDVKLNTKTSFGNRSSGVPNTTSPLHLNLTEGKMGHKIDIGNEEEMRTMFKTALDINVGGIVPSLSLKQVLGAVNSVSNERFNLVVCVKKMASSTQINSKNGPLTKTLITIFDGHGQEASLTMWGDTMASIVQQWVPFKTALILTGAQVGVYAMKPQITVGYQTHIQVDPECKNIEWLRHFAASCSSLPDELNPSNNMKLRIRDVAEAQEVPIEAIGTCYRIADISALAETLAVTEACPTCHVSPKNEDSWSFTLSRNISFMDDTGELYHPNMASSTIQCLLGHKCPFDGTEDPDQGILKDGW